MLYSVANVGMGIEFELYLEIKLNQGVMLASIDI